MKRTSKRLLALILALCMALSLLSASVWAADVSEDLAVESSESYEPEGAEAPDESEPEEPEAEESDARPGESEDDVSVEEAPEPAEAEPESEEPEAESEEPEQEADESAAEESAAAQAEGTHTHKDAKGNTITFQPWTQDAVNEQYALSVSTSEPEPADAAFTPSNCLPKSGSFYLTQNVTLTSTHQMEGNLNLCLSGKSVTLNDSGAVILTNGKDFSLFDENNKGIITHAEEEKGSGVVVGSGSEFQLYGGTISGNKATSNNGGGVFVSVESSFTMNGGTISGNSSGSGGGVYVYGGSSFTMNGGTISGNEASKSYGSYGGGVDVKSASTFTMNGGTISNNKANVEAGGVEIEENSTFYLNGGTISNNTASSGVGGGVANYESRVFMSGGTISGNKAMSGGGVYNYGSSSILMLGGTIKNNTAETDSSASQNRSGGGGVFNGGVFCISKNQAAIARYLGEIIVMEEQQASDAPSITGNTATFGGGVFNARGCFYCDMGSIRSNTAQTATTNETTDVGCGGGIMDLPMSLGSGAEDMGVAEAGVRQGNSRQEQVKTADSVPTGVLLAGNPTISDNKGPKGKDNIALTAMHLLESEEASDEEIPVPTPLKIEGKLTNKTPIGVHILYLKSQPVNSEALGEQAESEPNDPEWVAGVFTSGLPDNGSGSSFVSDSAEYGVTLVTADGDSKGEAQLLPMVKASAGDATATYDGKAHSINVKTETQGAKVRYSTDGGKTWSGKNPGFTDAGKYTVSYIAEAAGHAPATGKAILTVSAKAVTATADNKTSVYGGNRAALSFTVSGLVKASDKASLDLTASTTAKKGTDAGEYDITLKQGANASKNYKVTLKKGKYTISKANQSAPAAPKLSHTYWTSITVKKVKGQEYKLKGQKWGSSNTFENLTPGMTYTVYARRAADNNHFASKESAATKVRLPEAHLSANAAESGSKLAVQWDKDPNAGSYDVYVWYCDGKQPKNPTITKGKNVDTINLTQLNKKALNKKKNFSVQVVAKKGNVVVARSVVMHVAGSGNKNNTNPTGIKGLPAKNQLTMKLKKRKTLKLTAQKSGKRKLLDKTHGAAIRLLTSDDRIVTIKGTTLTAKGKGTCTVYVCALNGKEEKIKVTVT